MSSNDQYNKDVRFIEKIDGMLERRVDHTAYIFTFAACLLAHVMYLILFALAGAKIMAVFNIFSVLYYAASFFLINVVKEKLNLVYATIAEIMLHAVFATVCVGLGPNFAMFLLMIIPLAFLVPNKNKNVPFVILFISVPLYGVLNYYYMGGAHVIYDLSGTQLETVFYIINIIIGSAVLIYVAGIFTVMNIYIECKLRVQTEQLRLLASTDPLTKLYNRREMLSRLNSISSSGCVIGIGDIDDFKKVNDTYGHDKGDEVLSTVASLITKSLPEGASAARWGGEEFLFLIPGCGIEEGKKIADGVIDAIRANKFKSGNTEFTVTMTIGICRGSSEDNVYDVINTADSRLYKGKHNGKAHTEYE